MRTVAALYVEKDGCYFGLKGVEPWDEMRDARRYAGSHPVVAHPPCQRWGKLWAGQPLWIKRTGERKTKGDDQGCFKSALFDARRCGGVIEHPWGSHAWANFGLSMPPRSGGWIKADEFGGWTCCVEQGRYGHYARKPTLLVAYGIKADDLPELDWGKNDPTFPEWAIDKYGLAKCKRAGELAFQGGGKNSSPRIATPEAFRDLLLGLARLSNLEKPARRSLDATASAAERLSPVADGGATLSPPRSQAGRADDCAGKGSLLPPVLPGAFVSPVHAAADAAARQEDHHG